MELRHVRSFIAVAEELNFGRAARRLGLSQPPLSKQIQAFEGTLGVTLFERGKQGVRLTKSGEAVLVEAYRLIEQSDRLLQAARRAETSESGHLTIAYLPSAFYEILPRLLQRFRAVRPEVEISLKEYDTPGAVQELRTGRVDVAVIRMARIVEPLQSLLLRTERCFVALPSAHPLSGRNRLRLKDLAGESFVVPSSRIFPRYFNSMLEAFEKARVRPHFAHEALSIASQLAVVAAGIAVSLVPRSLRDSPISGVSFVPLVETISMIDLSLIWNGNAPSRLVEDFIAIAREIADPD